MTFYFLDTSDTPIDLADYNLKIVKHTGLGEVDPVIVKSSFANVDGSYYEGQYVSERTFTFKLVSRTDDPDEYHTARKNFGNLVKRYRQSEDLPLKVRHVADGTATGTIELSAYFAGGMGLDEPKGYKEFIIAAFESVKPWWEDATEGTTNLNASILTTFNNIAKRTGKAGWDYLDGGVNDTVDYITHSSDGSTILAGGRYTTAGTASTTARRVAGFSNSAWSEVGGGVDDNVYEIKFKPGTNQLWLCGACGTADPSSSAIEINSVAYYDFDTTAWGTISHSGTVGFPSSVLQSFDWDSDENVIFGGDVTIGDFHNAVVYDVNGGTLTYLTEGKAGDIGDGTAVYGLDNHVYKVKRIDNDDYTPGVARTYVTGAFDSWEDQAGTSSTANYTSFFIWRDYGHTFARGFKNSAGVATCTIYAIEEHPNGDVWFGGNQDNEATGTVGIKDLYRVAAFDGTRFQNMNVGDTDEAVYDIVYDPYSKEMIALGTFTEAGDDTNIQKVARHNGSVWLPESLDFSGVTGRSASTYGNEVVYGFSGTINAYISESTINYTGSAPGYPRIELSGPGTVNYIYNHTTDELIQFNNLVLYDEELLTIDLDESAKRVTSSFRSGNMERFLVDNGDIDTFHLTNGDNVIICNMGTAISTKRFVFKNRYTSIDDIY